MSEKYEEHQNVNKKEKLVNKVSVHDEHQGVNLKGTLVSVFFVGVIIVVMWVVVYMMYVAR